MARMSKLGRLATYIRREGLWTIVRLYNTDIVKFSLSPDGNHGIAVLNADHWMTTMTKTRMNQAANQYGLPFTVSQKNYGWIVDVGTQGVYEFRNGMQIKW